ncbi:glycosyltransferase [Geoglobus acetivorans]|uniref:Glycosyltransferase family 2 protein n=1 Tax=Geoglobus acetivorans TaxID=565033 RepID=A0ABZ3H4N9_GEOAI|nr:glycosyltransferase family 2 protein [Geoglobus acetivorans]
MQNDVAAVIPAYNEEIAIGSVVLRAKKYVDRVIVVDDGSTDKTAEIAELAGAEVIRLEENCGKAHALMVGFERAKELGYSVVVMLDGGGQHDPDEIPSLVEPILKGEADLVIGSRFLENNGKIPKYRMLGQKILTFVTNLGSEITISDSQSGFRAMNRKVLESINFESNGYSIESEMIARLSSKGLRIREVPISAIYDVPNRHKKNPLSHGMSVLNDIVGLIGYKRPMLLFGSAGFALTVIGLAFGFWAFSVYYDTNKLPYGPSIGSALFLILGLLMVTSGLILNSLVQIMKEHK